MARARWQITGCRHSGAHRRKAKAGVVRDPITKAMRREARAVQRRREARVDRATGEGWPASPREYRTVLEQVHAIRKLAQLVGVDEIDAAIAAIDTADAVGPVLDATAYRDNAQAMHEDRDVLVGVRHLACLGVREGTAAS